MGALPGDVLVASGSGDESGHFSLNGDCSVLNGCTDPEAYNHNPLAIFDDGSCIYPVVGCTDPEALNHEADAEVDDGSCYYESDILGCTDDGATNYNPAATYDDGSCFYPELEFDGLASEWCVGDTMTITWTGGDADALMYVGLINVTANARRVLGHGAQHGSFEWVVEDVAAGSALTYHLYLEEQPYPRPRGRTATNLKSSTTAKRRCRLHRRPPAASIPTPRKTKAPACTKSTPSANAAATAKPTSTETACATPPARPTWTGTAWWPPKTFC